MASTSKATKTETKPVTSENKGKMETIKEEIDRPKSERWYSDVPLETLAKEHTQMIKKLEENVKRLETSLAKSTDGSAKESASMRKEIQLLKSECEDDSIVLVRVCELIERLHAVAKRTPCVRPDELSNDKPLDGKNELIFSYAKKLTCDVNNVIMELHNKPEIRPDSALTDISCGNESIPSQCDSDQVQTITNYTNEEKKAYEDRISGLLQEQEKNIARHKKLVEENNVLKGIVVARGKKMTQLEKENQRLKSELNDTKSGKEEEIANMRREKEELKSERDQLEVEKKQLVQRNQEILQERHKKNQPTVSKHDKDTE